MRAMVNGHFGLVAFGVRVHSAERETHQTGDFTLGVLEQRVSEFDARAVYADAMKTVLAGFGTQPDDVLPGCLGFDQHMIDAASQLGARKCFHFPNKSPTNAFSSFNSLIVASILDRLNSLIGNP